MDRERVIVVTGVAGFWGGRVAAELVDRSDLHVIGIDREPPQVLVDGLDFIQADVRNPLIAELFQEEHVDAVVHLDFRENLTPSEAGFDQNVMGAAKLLAACDEAGVGQVVLKSSTMVYGARPDNPMFLREDHPLNAPKKYGYLRDWVEIERYVESFREQHSDTAVAVLRFGHIVGPKVDSPMTRFLREEEAVTLLGFDPMLQVIHEQDVIDALLHVIGERFDGAYNVAPEKGIPLWKALGLSSKIPLPVLHPLAYWSVSLGGPRLAPMPLDYLRFPCMGDMSKMRDELNFTPHYTPEETMREFATQQRVRKLLSKRSAKGLDQDLLRDTINRRKRMRETTGHTRTKRAQAS